MFEILDFFINVKTILKKTLHKCERLFFKNQKHFANEKVGNQKN